MIEIIALILSGLTLLMVALVLWHVCRKSTCDDTQEQASESLQQEWRQGFEQVRESVAKQASQDRQESASRDEALRVAMLERLDKLAVSQAEALEKVASKLDAFGQQQVQVLSQARESQTKAFGDLHEKLTQLFQHAGKQQIEAADKLRSQVQERLEGLQKSNDMRLEKMQHTVDEKLQTALDKRLTESFKQVSERLEQVHTGLGRMQELAGEVGDLKRVMTNVKTRGTWGEVVLGNLLEQVMVPSQYEANCKVRSRSDNRVEYAIRLPGLDGDSQVWLPIDAKFPKEDFERLVDASERADAEGVRVAQKALTERVKSFARDIRDKYIAPPETTDFAILFLPTEGLYAELARQPGFVDTLQREYRVTLAGPNTMLALLNSLQMGFRTLAVQKQSAQVWKVLGAVKTEFGKFADTVEAVSKNLSAAQSKLENDLGTRSRVLARNLAKVEALPETESTTLLDGEAEG